MCYNRFDNPENTSGAGQQIRDHEEPANLPIGMSGIKTGRQLKGGFEKDLNKSSGRKIGVRAGAVYCGNRDER